MGEFSDVLKEIGSIDPADLTILDGLSTKYPALDNAVIRSKELTRKQSSFEREKTALEAQKNELQSKVSGWDTWRDDNWVENPDNPLDGMTKGEKQAREDLARVTLRLTEMEAGQITGGGPMDQNDFASVSEYLRAQGFVNKTDLAGFAPLAELTSVKTTHGNALNGFEAIYKRATPLITRYAREYAELGDDFDLAGFSDYVVADPNRLQDINKAYDDFLAPKKAQLAMKKESDRLAQWNKDLEAKAAEQVAASAAAPSPSDTSGAGPEIGHFQRRVMTGDKKEEGAVNAPLGSGVSAMVAAEQYRKGEFKTQVQ